MAWLKGKPKARLCAITPTHIVHVRLQPLLPHGAMLMPMLSKLRHIFDSLRRGEPGHRFVDHHERRKKAEGPTGAWKSAGYVILGVVLLLAGLVLSLPPGVPGFLLWIPGLGLLAVRFRILAVYLDKLEVLGRRLWGQMKLLWKRLVKD